MEISNGTALLILAAVAILFILIAKCRSKKDNFTRTPLSNCTNCRFVRTPVDYALLSSADSPLSAGSRGWQSNPHWIANPEDRYQPLDFGPVDFWAEQRKLTNGKLWKQYGNNFVDGTQAPYIVNDSKTRSLLTETGDMTMRSILDNMPASTQPMLGAQDAEEMVRELENPYNQSAPQYGGPNYFFRETIGS